MQNPAKTIAVCFSGEQWTDPPLDEENWRTAYGDLGEEITKRGHRFWVVRHAASYRGDNHFAGGWEFRDGSFVQNSDDCFADLVINKSRDFMPRGHVHVINNPIFSAICENKWATVKMFPDLFPASYLAATADEFQAALRKLQTPIVVAKPLTGSGGNGVIIESKQDIGRRTLCYPIIVQEFLDSSAGIPGFVSTYFDLRMIIAGGELIFTFTRSPARGRLLSNTSQGGYMMMMQPEEVPMAAQALYERIDAAFSAYPDRLYAIDCTRNAEGEWKLIELNDQPGIQTRMECGSRADAYFDSLTRFLLRA